MDRVPDAVIAASLLLVAAGAAAASVTGVARTRCGAATIRRPRSRTAAPPGPAPMRYRPFSGPAATLLWGEWRKSGLNLPIAVATIYLVLTGLGLCGSELGPLELPFHGSLLQIDSGQAARTLLVTAVLLLLWLGSMLGAGAGQRDPRDKDRTLSLYYATRPVTSAALVRAKLVSIGGSLAVCCAVLVGFLLPWSLLYSAHDAVGSGPLLQILLRHAVPVDLLRLALALLCLWLLLWKRATDGMVFDLAGRPWISSTAVPILTSAFGIASLLIFVTYFQKHPERLIALATTWGPTVLAVALALKLATGAAALLWLRRRAQIDTPTAFRCALLWIAAAIALPLALRAAFPILSPLPLWEIGAVVALNLLPLARISLAPIALAWNRHR